MLFMQKCPIQKIVLCIFVGTKGGSKRTESKNKKTTC